MPKFYLQKVVQATSGHLTGGSRQLDHLRLNYKPAEVVHTCNPNPLELKTGRLRDQGKPELYETNFKTNRDRRTQVWVL